MDLRGTILEQQATMSTIWLLRNPIPRVDNPLGEMVSCLDPIMEMAQPPHLAESSIGGPCWKSGGHSEMAERLQHQHHQQQPMMKTLLLKPANETEGIPCCLPYRSSTERHPRPTATIPTPIPRKTTIQTKKGKVEDLGEAFCREERPVPIDEWQWDRLVAKLLFWGEV